MIHASVKRNQLKFQPQTLQTSITPTLTLHFMSETEKKENTLALHGVGLHPRLLHLGLKLFRTVDRWVRDSLENCLARKYAGRKTRRAWYLVRRWRLCCGWWAELDAHMLAIALLFSHRPPGDATRFALRTRVGKDRWCGRWCDPDPV